MRGRGGGEERKRGGEVKRILRNFAASYEFSKTFFQIRYNTL